MTPGRLLPTGSGHARRQEHRPGSDETIGLVISDDIDATQLDCLGGGRPLGDPDTETEADRCTDTDAQRQGAWDHSIRHLSTVRRPRLREYPRNVPVEECVRLGTRVTALGRGRTLDRVVNERTHLLVLYKEPVVAVGRSQDVQFIRTRREFYQL